VITYSQTTKGTYTYARGTNCSQYAYDNFTFKAENGQCDTAPGTAGCESVATGFMYICVLDANTPPLASPVSYSISSAVTKSLFYVPSPYDADDYEYAQADGSRSTYGVYSSLSPLTLYSAATITINLVGTIADASHNGTLSLPSYSGGQLSCSSQPISPPATIAVSQGYFDPANFSLCYSPPTAILGALDTAVCVPLTRAHGHER